MGYKSLLTVLRGPEAAADTLAGAVRVAQEHDAHLEVLCVGIDRTQVGYYYDGASTLFLQTALEQAARDSQAILAAARATLKNVEVRWSAEAVVTQIGSLNTLIGLRSRFVDLVVLAAPARDGRDVEAESVLEAALFEGQAPVFVIPGSLTSAPLARRILLAWNQSNEALAAARKALPLLTAADLVNITVIDPPQQGPERSDPGGALSQLLARHGAKIEVSVLARGHSVAEVITRHALDMDADTIVMGAYGHSRLRQAILGGATYDMLHSTKLPMLMAH